MVDKYIIEGFLKNTLLKNAHGIYVAENRYVACVKNAEKQRINAYRMPVFLKNIWKTLDNGGGWVYNKFPVAIGVSCKTATGIIQNHLLCRGLERLGYGKS